MVLRTLIVDDEPIARQILREELEQIDEIALIGEAEDGVAALQAINDSSPDLVFLDLQMPGMSGLELLTMMRAHGNRAPFIFITAFPDETSRARALKAGAICFLSKPFAGPTLINCLGVALEGHPREKDT